MRVLGLSAFYHDSAAALVVDGRLVAAAQEERFTRKKNDSGFPSRAVEYCLDEAKVTLEQLDYVGFYDKPLLTFDRLLETYLGYAPTGFTSFSKALPVWVKEKLLLKGLIKDALNALGKGTVRDNALLFGYHHESHAAAAYFPSPFDSAAILVMDGVGEWATTTLGKARGTDIELLKEIRFPHSLGLLYAAFTYHLGFKINDGEYKVMGLAPYGEPRHVQKIRDHLIDLKADGSFRLNMEYFNYCTGLTMTNDRFSELFDGCKPRAPADRLTQFHMDLARSVQAVTEETVLRMCRTLRQETGERNLCMAGGVALNCVANGKVHKDGIFDRIWVQPASGDAGSAAGVAWSVYYRFADSAHRTINGCDGMQGSYLGPAYSPPEIARVLDSHDARYHLLDDESLFAKVAQALSEDRVVGWFQGRMEFGPRALGNRSILGNPGSRDMQSVLNLKIKYRESFRPFAPAVPREDVGKYFDFTDDSPYMLMVAPVRQDRCRVLTPEEEALFGIDKLKVARSEIPAVTHVDYSARIQTVAQDTNPRFHRLLREFEKKTGCSVLVNTSFNIRDEPVVCSPGDAYRCFMGTEMDVLVLDNYLLWKEEQ